MKSAFKRAVFAAFASMFALTGVVGAETPKHGGTMIWAIQGTPRHLNPSVQSGIATGEPGAQLFAAPLRYDENWTPQPYLAESWEVSEDGLTVTLNLVKDAKFHDGVPITSKDVAFSIETVKANHPFKTMFAPVASVDTSDPHVAVLKLSQPHPALMLAMSSQLLPIIPEHVYGDGQDPKTHPRNSEDVVGSGPFKLVEFKRDQHIILERNENFFIKDRPYLDRIVMRIIKDGSARAIALENGEVHLSAFEQNPRDIARLQKNPDITATANGYGAIGPIAWLAFNTKREPISDVRVRQAIAYAVDRNFIVKAIFLGTSQPALTGIHPDSPFYDPSVEGYDLDIDKANNILDEAGYARGSDGMRFKLTVDFGWPSIKAPAEYLKPQLKKIGIDLSVRASADFPTWAKRISNHDFDMTWDVVFNWGDPVIGVHRTYLSNNIKTGVIWSNTQQYENKEVDEILEMAGKERDSAKRKALYAKFQHIVAQELPVYWSYTLPYHTIHASSIGNAPGGIWATCAPLDRVYLK